MSLRNDNMRFSVLGFRSDIRIEFQGPVACLTLCMLGNFFSFCRLLIFFFKINFFEKFFQDYNQSVNCLDPDQV